MLSTINISDQCVAELLQNAERQLHSSDTARLDAEILLCHVAKLDRSTLYAHPERIIDKKIISGYQSLINARKKGEPVAYLINSKEFWSMHFTVTEQTLIPRPDTECLVANALELLPENKSLKIADLGTGCGVIAICIASERPQCHVTATDISPGTIEIARQNANHHRINNISFITSDWFENINDHFHMIVSNPPYIKENDEHLKISDIQHEPLLSLTSGDDGLDAIRHIIRHAQNYLFPGGYLLLEHGFDQGEKTRSLLDKQGFTGIETFQDFGGNDRVSIGKFFN